MYSITAEMLNDPQYDEFIDKLVFLGIIDSKENLEDIANAFNIVSTSAENGTNSIDKVTSSLSETQIEAFETYKKNIETISSALSDIHNLEASDIASLMAQFAQYGEVFKQFGVDGTKGTGDLKGALEEVSRQMKETAKKNVPKVDETDVALDEARKSLQENYGTLFDLTESESNEKADDLKQEIEELNQALEESAYNNEDTTPIYDSNNAVLNLAKLLVDRQYSVKIRQSSLRVS